MGVLLRSSRLPSDIWCCNSHDGPATPERRRLARRWEKRQWRAEVDEEVADGDWLPDDPWEMTYW